MAGYAPRTLGRIAGFHVGVADKLLPGAVGKLVETEIFRAEIFIEVWLWRSVAIDGEVQVGAIGIGFVSCETRIRCGYRLARCVS